MSRITLTVVDPVASRWSDVRLEADDAATVADVALQLRHAVQAEPEPALAGVVQLRPRADRQGPERAGSAALFLAGRALDLSEPLATSGIRDGVIVSIGDPRGCILPEPSGAVEVRVAGGPSAGDVVRLNLGEVTVGTGEECALRVPRGPGHAATVVVQADGVVRVRPAGGATLLQEQAPLAGETVWHPGVQLRIPDAAGDVVLELGIPGPADAALEAEDDGGLAFNRPPRLAPYHEEVVLTRPKAPDKPGGVHIPWVIAMLPLVLGGAAFWFTRKSGGFSPIFLVFMLMSPLMLVGSAVGNLRSGRKKYRQDLKTYKLEASQFDGKVEAARRAEELDRRGDGFDPAQALLVAAGPRRELWERRPSDPDALQLRIGLADLPAARLEVRDGSDTEPAPVTHSVPVSVSLREAGVVGIAGPRPLRAPLARWLALQLATLHSPVDVGLVLLCARPREECLEWEWTRWLPHLRAGDGALRLGLDPESCATRAAELASLVESRQTASRGGGGFGAAQISFDPVVVVLDGARDLRRLAGIPTVLADGPGVGVYAVCLDDEERLLPEECSAVVVVRSLQALTLKVSLRARIDDVLADGVGVAHAERAARAMAPVRDVSRDDQGARLPASARLLRELGLEDLDPDAIVRRWAHGGRTTTALLGVGETGPFTVDMRLDGPHGLVAGTTGSGKSELLQTLIASLAVGNRPDEFTFVLVDYKGGAAFKDCNNLPHTVGMVTDLDGHLTTRALESLAAELHRREHQLAGAGAKDIEDYQAEMQPGGAPMPRLLIVIDEFAALVSELPDFVVGLVDIARRGRSLGVHLILATQRPSGVVSNDIKSNTNLRIALRVTDRDDSTDVIDAPDAAHISKATPGRAYARLGHSSLIAFQSARVGGKPPMAGEMTSAAIAPAPFDDAASPWRALRTSSAEDDPTRPSDLASLVATITEAVRRSGISPPPPPWLPALGDVAVLEELGLADDVERGVVPPLAFGIGDVPSEQRRSVETFDLTGSGHLMVAGTARSGRSSVLRALAAALGRTVDPRDVHLYGIDCGNNALLPLTALPHTGAVVTRDQPDRLTRLVTLLLAEVTRRQQLLAALGYADVNEQRRAVDPDERLPYLLVFLDRWEGFMAAYENYDMGRLIDNVYRLLQEGAGVGIKLVVTADRSGLIGKISTLVDDRLVLRMTDPADYSTIGLLAREVPEHMPPGRAFRSEGIRETQVALLTDDVAGTAQVAELMRIGREAAERCGDTDRRHRPARVDQLPMAATYEAAHLGLTGDEASTFVLVGVGGDTLGPRGIDVAEYGPALVVAGAPRTGRSTTLLTMVSSLLDKGWSAVVLTPRRSPLRTLAGRLGVVCLTPEQDADALQAALDAAPRPVALVVDDLELVDPDSLHSTTIERFIASIRDSGDAVLAGGGVEELAAMYRGPVVAMKKSRTGVILAPRSYSDGDLLSARLPREVGGSAPAGRGVLVRGGQWEPVQVAAPPTP